MKISIIKTIQYFCILLFLNFSGVIWAQGYDSQPTLEKSFNKGKWEKIKEGIDYNESKVKEQKEKPNQKSRRGESSGDNSSSTSSNQVIFQNNTFFKYLFFTLSILGLILVILKIIKNQRIYKKIPIANKVKNIEQTIDEVEETDLEALLSESIKSNNYKLSIRIYYLIVLKVLSEKSLIKWKKDKTNKMYERELRKTHFHLDFKRITLEFEKAWFSNIELTKEEYQHIEPKFQNFISNIKL